MRPVRFRSKNVEVQEGTVFLSNSSHSPPESHFTFEDVVESGYAPRRGGRQRGVHLIRLLPQGREPAPRDAREVVVLDVVPNVPSQNVERTVVGKSLPSSSEVVVLRQEMAGAGMDPPCYDE